MSSTQLAEMAVLPPSLGLCREQREGGREGGREGEREGESLSVDWEVRRSSPGSIPLVGFFYGFFLWPDLHPGS